MNINFIPLDVPVRLIDEYGNQYIGIATKHVSGNYITRGECYEGDSDTFYRSAIVSWQPLT